MTPQQLEALAVYRTHKYCKCEDCELARQALAEYDSQPRVNNGKTSQAGQTIAPPYS